MFERERLSTRVSCPLEPGDHPELDLTDFLEGNSITTYQSLIGMLQWAITIGRIDIQQAVMTMSRFSHKPRKGHLDRVKRIFSYLKRFKSASIKFNTYVPEYADLEIDQLPDWKYIYGNCKEETPENTPEPRGKRVVISSFVDANLMHDIITGRSVSGILHMLNKTPIEWFSKRQNQVETATYGSEFMALRIATKQVIKLRYQLCMLGVPVDEPSWMFGDNMSTVVSGTIPSSTLKNIGMHCHITRLEKQ